MSDVVLVLAVIVICFAPIVLDTRDAKRRRTAAERARRATQNMIIDYLGGCAVAGHPTAEDTLRRMLIDDLCQIRDRRVAIDFIREHHGIEIEWPPPKDLLPPSFLVRTARSIRVKLSSAWAAR